MRTLLRSLPALALLVLLAPPTSAQIDTAGGGTVVTVHGSTIKVTLNIDLLFEAPSEGLEWSERFRAYTSAGLAAAAAFWNNALKGIPAGECFDIQIEVVPNYIEFGGSAAGGGHDIRVLWDFDPRFESPQLTTETVNDDTVQVFTTNGTGYFPPWMFAVDYPRDLAHELGHLFGLGDDYATDADGTQETLPGREGTLMDGGDRVDQELVDRILDLVKRSGKQLPECWEGTVDSAVSAVGLSRGGQGLCPDPTFVQGTARIVVAADGSATGTYDVTGCGVSEPHAEFTGTVTDAGLLFPDLIVFTDGQLIPKVSPTEATGTFTNCQCSGGGGARWVTTWELTCEECDDVGVG